MGVSDESLAFDQLDTRPGWWTPGSTAVLALHSIDAALTLAAWTRLADQLRIDGYNSQRSRKSKK